MESGDFIVQTIITVGGIVASFFGLMRYSIQQSRQQQKEFYDFIEKKNGVAEKANDRTERVAKDFNDTVKHWSELLTKLTVELERTSTNQLNVTGIISMNTRILHDIMKFMGDREEKVKKRERREE